MQDTLNNDLLASDFKKHPVIARPHSVFGEVVVEAKSRPPARRVNEQFSRQEREPGVVRRVRVDRCATPNFYPHDGFSAARKLTLEGKMTKVLTTKFTTDCADFD